MRKLTFQDIRERNLLLYEYVRGSVAYGTNVESSDRDTGGVFLEPIEQILGLGLDFQEQIEDEKGDTVWYSLHKFMNLLCKSNPTVLEALFVPDEYVIYEHPIMTEIKKHKSEFITKECFGNFSGYALSQIRKCHGQNRLIMNPISKRLWPLDFCYTTYKQGSANMREWLKHRGLEQKYCGLVALNNMPSCFSVFYDWGAYIADNGWTFDDLYNNFDNDCNSMLCKFSKYISQDIIYWGEGVPSYHYALERWLERVKEPQFYRGIVAEDGRSDEVRCSSVKKDEAPICMLCFNINGYGNHCKKYKEYTDWVKKRNPQRYEHNLEHNYDCYLDEETEFLTKQGWKKYDEITDEDLIATFDSTHTIQWGHYVDRYAGIYSGPMYTLETSYTRCVVTPNHKMHISHCPRNPKTNFKCIYKEGINVWENVPIDEWINNRKGGYFIVNNLQNANPDNANYTDNELLVLGYFLSDGTIGYNNKKTPYISISQLEKTKGFPLLNELSDNGVLRKYSYERKGRLEYSFHCTDKHILSMVEECIKNGHYSFEKTLPSFVFDLSKRQFDILLKGMMMGDGSFHKKGHLVYYTSSKKMASDLHTLLTINGYNAQIYGKENSSYDKKYENSQINRERVVYQVFISKDNTQFKVFTKRIIGQANNKNCGYSIDEVNNKRIVCFTMQNGNIVTRNRNKIAFHGNSKNVCHCFRLLRMGLEVARDGSFNVDRRGIDADFLKSIRNAEYEYEVVMEMAEKEFNEMEEAMKTSTLPETVDREKINDLLVSIRKKYQLQ